MLKLDWTKKNSSTFRVASTKRTMLSLPLLLLTFIISFFFSSYITEATFAAPGDPSSNVVTLEISPIDETKTDYRMYFNAADSTYGQFGTVGIRANVKTPNNYGYSLYVRSNTKGAEFLNINPDFANSGAVIKPLQNSCEVVSASGSGWQEMNRYGWSTNWNPTTARGTFNPMSTIDTRIKRRINATNNDGENTEIYIGALVNDNIMHGTYSSTLVFTALPNSLADISVDYVLHYDLNGGTPDAVTFPDQTVGGIYYTPTNISINTNVPVKTPFDFAGWDTDRNATVPTYVYSNGTVTPSTITVTNEETTLYAIWAPKSYNLVFNANGGNGAPATITRSSTEYEETFNIPTSQIPTKYDPNHPTMNMIFYGYATTAGTHVAEYEYKNGSFTPSTITIPASAPTVTLYAIWGGEFENAFEEADVDMTMQNMTKSICDDVPTPQTPQDSPFANLVDVRDNKEYKIAKLPDGRCWMAEDLKLTTTNTLTSNDTNIVPGHTFNLPTAQSSGTTQWAANGNNIYYNPAESESVYYSAYSATAGTYTNVAGAEDFYYESVCPKGWRLPSGGPNERSYSEYYNLHLALGSSGEAWLQPPFSASKNGLYRSGSGTYYIGQQFHLLTGTASHESGSTGATYSYIIEINNRWGITFNNNQAAGTTGSSIGYHGNYGGFAIRCINNDSVKSMQKFTSADANAMSIGDTLTLYDERDNKEYTVSKFADGQVWMGGNLALGNNGTTIELNSQNSNLNPTTTFILPVSASGTWNDGTNAKRAASRFVNGVADGVVYSTNASGSNNAYDSNHVYATVKKIAGISTGNYYSYWTATAGSGGLFVSGNATESICPKGWRLPVGGVDYNNLYTLRSSYSAMNAAPYNFTLEGYRASGNMADKGTYGLYTTSTATSSTVSTTFGLDSTGMTTLTTARQYRYNGKSVRCIFDPSAAQQQSSKASPLGVSEGTDSFLSDNGPAIIIATTAGIAVTASSLFIALIVKKKKDDEDKNENPELN